MKWNKAIYGLIAFIAVAFSSTIESIRTEEMIGIGLFVYVLLDFIDSIGRTYNILDIPILLALFQYVLMPAVVYHNFNDDPLVIALKYDMTVSADVYYGYMLPAIIAMTVGMKLPPIFMPSFEQRFQRAVFNVRAYLKGRGNLGVLLMLIGFVPNIFRDFVTGQIQYIVYLLSLLLYIGVLYTYFSDHKQRKWFLIGGLVVISVQAIAKGMFGELVYVMLLAVQLTLLGTKIKNSLKFSLAIVGIFAVILLQSIKAEFRDITWRGIGAGNESKTEVFFNLVTGRLTELDQFADIKAMFPTINRFNQGMIVGKVLDHVPKNAPYAEGETIFVSLAATFVPRLLWPDKPIAGGQFNMERFAGFRIEGVSMNISPMGEAYGNYGVQGGIFFMFLYGLFFSLLIVILMNNVKNRPTLILWFPVLFLNSIQIETDVLMCLNSFIKNGIFVAFCYWAFYRFMRLKL